MPAYETQICAPLQWMCTEVYQLRSMRFAFVRGVRARQRHYRTDAVTHGIFAPMSGFLPVEQGMAVACTDAQEAMALEVLTLLNTSDVPSDKLRQMFYHCMIVLASTSVPHITECTTLMCTPTMLTLQSALMVSMPVAGIQFEGELACVEESEDMILCNPPWRSYHPRVDVYHDPVA